MAAGLLGAQGAGAAIGGGAGLLNYFLFEAPAEERRAFLDARRAALMGYNENIKPEGIISGQMSPIAQIGAGVATGASIGSQMDDADLRSRLAQSDIDLNQAEIEAIRGTGGQEQNTEAGRSPSSVSSQNPQDVRIRNLLRQSRRNRGY